MARKLFARFFWLCLVFMLCVIIKLMSWKAGETIHLNIDHVGHKTNKRLGKVEISRVISSAATFIKDKIKPATTSKPKIKETISKPKAALKQKPVISSSRVSTSQTNHSTTLEDVTITIKSTIEFHRNRIALLLRTWMKRVLNQVNYIL